jgi:hypothetical protein
MQVQGWMTSRLGVAQLAVNTPRSSDNRDGRWSTAGVIVAVFHRKSGGATEVNHLGRSSA